MKLMIVESPNKIKKIKTYLDSDWLVAASVGHICDLPKDEMGVEPPNFKPKYVIYDEKKKVVANLKTLLKQADTVYLATDFDREGEAISYHIKQLLGLKDYKRITFNEITKSAITNSIKNARLIDNQMVYAQEARRVLDRIFGYTLSPILSQQAGIKLSAGRVQSVAVKIVVLREQEITQFRKRNFFVLQITLDTGLVLELNPKPFAENGKHIFDLDLINRLASAAKQISVTDIQTEDKNVNPRAPFTTSTLQQAASSILKMSPADAMKNAQALFEQGAITYHRTDSQNLSQDGFNLACEKLKAINLPHQSSQIKYATKASAQEAHEAIRPTAFDDEAGETADQKKLYSLILERTLTSAMPAGIDTVTTITAKIENSQNEESAKAIFTATGKIVKQPGWRSRAILEPYQSKDQVLSGAAEAGKTYITESSVLTKTTEPPSRFTEATLIKALEALGVGRPSTYASIMENIKQREYINISKKGTAVINATPLGIAVVEALDQMPFMNLSYTAQMEEQLDLIANGKASYLFTVQSAYGDLQAQLHTIKIPLLVNTSPCPACGEPLKRIKNAKGFFWVHAEENHAEDCGHKFIPDQKGSPVMPAQKVTKACQKCGQLLVQRTSAKDAKKTFWVHEIDNAECEKFIWDN